MRRSGEANVNVDAGAAGAVGEVLGEFPLPPRVRPADVRVAVRAVVVHAGQSWPAGAFCRNCRAPHPCRLARWGRRVLRAAGVPDERIDALITAGDPRASGALW